MRQDSRSTSISTATRRAVIAGSAALVATSRAASAARPSGQPIRIGVSAPLTAQFAQDGAWMKNGVTLAARQINERGGIKGRPVKLYFEDDQGPNPTAAANAVTKLVTEDQVVAMLGPHFTPAMLPSEPILARYKIPALTGATGPVVTQQHDPYVFRMRLNDAIGAKLLVKYLVVKLGWKKIGLDYVNTAFGQSGAAAVKEALSQHGITPAVTQTHLDSTKDFTSQLLTFQQAKVEGIIVWTDDQPGGLIAKQHQTLGMKYGLAGSTTFSQPPFLSLGGTAADGAYAITDFIAQNASPAITTWKKLYRGVYGQDPELYASTYYDAMNVLAWAIGHATSVTGPAIREALTKVKDLPGVMTRYTWSSSGDMVHSGLITIIKNQIPVVLSEVSA